MWNDKTDIVNWSKNQIRETIKMLTASDVDGQVQKWHNSIDTRLSNNTRIATKMKMLVCNLIQVHWIKRPIASACTHASILFLEPIRLRFFFLLIGRRTAKKESTVRLRLLKHIHKFCHYSSTFVVHNDNNIILPTHFWPRALLINFNREHKSKQWLSSLHS